MPLSPLATALVLFALTGHALFAVTGHSHAGSGPLVSDRQGDASRVEGRQDVGASNKAGGHAQCLLCRLQRDFTSGLRHGVPQVAAPPAPSQGFARSSRPAVASAVLLSPTGRAPPTLS